MEGAFIYCESGPYRHARALLEDRDGTWLPWGYPSSLVHPELSVGAGSFIEVWAVDDFRTPTSAQFVTGAVVDFAAKHEGYLAVTMRTVGGLRSSMESTDVLEGASRGYLAIPVPLSSSLVLHDPSAPSHSA